MGASRESFGIISMWKYGLSYFKNGIYYSSKDINIFIKIYLLIKKIIVCLKNKYTRHDFYIDNVVVPYNKLQCKIFKNHNYYYYDNDDNLYYCRKCFRRLTPDEYQKEIRMKKIKTIL